MSDNSLKSEVHRFLHWSWRIAFSLVGLILLLLSLVLTYSPPVRQTVDTDAKGRIVKTTSAIADQSPFAIAVFIAGVFVLVFAANGLRIERIGAGDFELETSSAARKAKEYYSSDPAPPKEVKSEDPLPEPKTVGKEVRVDASAYETFELKDVPFKVLEDVKNDWPAGVDKIESFDSFEFAQRRRGKGNNAWLLKFRDRPMIKVTYGGQGKSESTVSTE